MSFLKISKRNYCHENISYNNIQKYKINNNIANRKQYCYFENQNNVNSNKLSFQKNILKKTTDYFILQKRIKENREIAQSILESDSEELIKPLEPLFKSKYFSKIAKYIGADLMLFWAENSSFLFMNRVSELFDSEYFYNFTNKDALYAFNNVVYSAGILPQKKFDEVLDLFKDDSSFDPDKLLEIHSSYYKQAGMDELSQIMKTPGFTKLFNEGTQMESILGVLDDLGLKAE